MSPALRAYASTWQIARPSRAKLCRPPVRAGTGVAKKSPGGSLSASWSLLATLVGIDPRFFFPAEVFREVRPRNRCLTSTCPAPSPSPRTRAFPGCVFSAAFLAVRWLDGATEQIGCRRGLSRAMGHSCSRDMENRKSGSHARHHHLLEIINRRRALFQQSKQRI